VEARHWPGRVTALPPGCFGRDGSILTSTPRVEQLTIARSSGEKSEELSLPIALIRL
jgi:hypothetical protein